MSGFKILIWVCFLFGFSAIQALADDAWRSEMLFLSGYQSYLDHNYANCADQFYGSIEDGVSEKDRAELYLAACQAKIKKSDLAAYHFIKVHSDELPASDQALYQKLQSKLSKEIESAQRLQIWVNPYVGTLAYIKKSSTASGATTSGVYYGFNIDLIKNSTKISIAAQALSAGNSSQTNSSLLQAGLGLEQSLSDYFSLRIKGLYIAATLTQLSSIKIGELGMSVNLTNPLKFNFDYFFSSYPNLTLGNLSLSQITATLNWRIYQGSKGVIEWEIGSETILPHSALGTDSFTGFTLNTIYQRTFTQLKLNWTPIGITGGGWYGNEAFGIRNNGMIIYSTLEEHHFGWNLGISVAPEYSWGIQFFFLQEDLIMSKSEYLTNTLYGGVYFKI